MGIFQSKQNKQTKHNSPAGLLGWVRARDRLVRREEKRETASAMLLSTLLLGVYSSFLSFFFVCEAEK